MSSDAAQTRASVLRSPKEFQSVYQEGKKRASRAFVVFMKPNQLDCSRFGLTTPRKLGKAHERNRIRRRIREVIRKRGDRFPVGLDIVINPRRPVLDLDFGELCSEFTRLLGES